MGDVRDRGRKGSAAFSEVSTPSFGSGDGGSREPGEGSELRRKRARGTFLVQNACNRCRQKKSKCDGVRPTCGRCERHGAECTYDVAQEGLTRMQNLQQQLETKTEDEEKLQRVFNQLQQGSDQEATALLARLRLGADIDELVQFARQSHASSSRMPNGSSNFQRQQPQQQQASYGQNWETHPMTDGSGWNQWQGTWHHDPNPSFESAGEGEQAGPSTSEYTDFATSDHPYYQQLAMPDGTSTQPYGAPPGQFQHPPYMGSTQWQQPRVPDEQTHMDSQSSDPDRSMQGTRQQRQQPPQSGPHVRRRQ